MSSAESSPSQQPEVSSENDDGAFLLDLSGAATGDPSPSRSRSNSIDSKNSMGSKSVESTEKLWHLENELERIFDETPIGASVGGCGGADGGNAGIGRAQDASGSPRVTARTSRWAAAAREEVDEVSNRRAARRKARAAARRKQQEEANLTLRSNSGGSSPGGENEEALVTSSTTGVPFGSRHNIPRDRSKTIKRRGLAQLEAAALGGQQGIAAGGGGTVTTIRRNLLAGSLRQIEPSLIQQQEKASGTCRRNLHSTCSHDSNDDNESLEEGIEPPCGAGGSPRLGHESASSIANRQSDLSSSKLFSGLEIMGNLEDLDPNDLDRIHNKRASLELHELAEHGGAGLDISSYGSNGGGASSKRWWYRRGKLKAHENALHRDELRNRAGSSLQSEVRYIL